MGRTMTAGPASGPEVVVGAVAAERRGCPRVARLASGAICTDSRVFHCQVLDISAGGAKVRVVGDPGTLETARCWLGGAAVVDCEVCWAEGRVLGLRFLDAPEAVRRLMGDPWADALRVAEAG